MFVALSCLSSTLATLHDIPLSHHDLKSRIFSCFRSASWLRILGSSLNFKDLELHENRVTGDHVYVCTPTRQSTGGRWMCRVWIVHFSRLLRLLGLGGRDKGWRGGEESGERRRGSNFWNNIGIVGGVGGGEWGGTGGIDVGRCWRRGVGRRDEKCTCRYEWEERFEFWKGDTSISAFGYREPRLVCDTITLWGLLVFTRVCSGSWTLLSCLFWYSVESAFLYSWALWLNY